MEILFKSAPLLVVLLISAHTTPLHARDDAIHYFEYLFIEQGLPHSTVFDILQDHLGFMWFGTEDGLAKYDGNEFTVYRHDPTNSDSLSNSAVYALCQDNRHNLWLATRNGGINKFDPATETFTHYRHDESAPHTVSTDSLAQCNIYEDSQGTLWFGTAGGGLNRFDPATEQIIVYRYDKNDSGTLSHDTIYHIHPDPSGKWLWIGTQKGLNKFAPATGKTIRYFHDRNNPDSPGHNSIRAICCLSGDDPVWIGTDHGLIRFNPHNGTVTHYVHHEDKPDSLSHNAVRVIYPADNGKLWIGTDGGGLNLFDPVAETFIRYLTDSNSTPALIKSLFKDNTGILWIGTSLSGLAKLDPQRKKFRLYRHHPQNPDSLTVSDIFGLHADRQGIVWIGTVGGGLNKFDPVTEQFAHYTHDRNQPHSLSHNFVHPVLEDSKGLLWVGTWGGGLNKFDPQSQQFTHYKEDPDDPHSLIGVRVRAIAEDDLGNLWIGTDKGLNKFDRQAERFTHYQHRPGDAASLISNNIRNIFKDTRGNLWISTGRGLDRLDPQKDRFIHYQHDENDPNSLSENVVINIYEDSQGILWFATRRGLNRFDPQRRQFRHYFEKHGLPHNRVQSILGDNQGCLWLATVNGLARFDPREETFKIYDASDGLQGNFFRAWAYARHPNGELYFGGTNGLSRFHPAEIRDNPHLPPVVLTNFLLFNSPVPIGEGSVLRKHISNLDSLTLTHEHSVFSFEFAGLNYTSSAKNRYAYKMEGFDNDWIETDASRRVATYTNLNPGSYTFRVKASNNDGLWNEQGASLRVIITPPWWKTTLFRVSVILVIIGILCGASVWQRWNAHRRERRLENLVAEQTRELVRAKEAAENASQAKTTFLANMSHELRTPLNAILGYAQILKRSREFDMSVKDGLNVIQQSGNHLMTLISDILDLSKIEARKMKLYPSAINFPHFLEGIASIIRMRAQQKDVYFAHESDPELPACIEADEKCLRQILLNLLGNAVKFTESGGTVTFRVHGHKFGDSAQEPAKTAIANLCFETRDTGVGMTAEQVKKIFEPFEQVCDAAHQAEGAGLGLSISRQLAELMGGTIKVETRPGKGSAFRFEATFTVVTGETEAASEPACIITSYEAEQQQKVLVADDNAENRLVLVNLLVPMGFDVMAAEHGQEAVGKTREFLPDVILMDLIMPVMNGFEAVRVIRQTEKFKALPILAVSASSADMDQARIRRMGFNGFLPKPLDARQLFDFLGDLLPITWRYETLPGEEQQAVHPVSGSDIIPPPRDELEILYELAEIGMMRKIRERTFKLEKQDAQYAGFAAKIRNIADTFDQDRMISLLRRYFRTET